MFGVGAGQRTAGRRVREMAKDQGSKKKAEIGVKKRLKRSHACHLWVRFRFAKPKYVCVSNQRYQFAQYGSSNHKHSQPEERKHT